MSCSTAHSLRGLFRSASTFARRDKTTRRPTQRTPATTANTLAHMPTPPSNEDSADSLPCLAPLLTCIARSDAVPSSPLLVFLLFFTPPSSSSLHQYCLTLPLHRPSVRPQTALPARARRKRQCCCSPHAPPREEGDYGFDRAWPSSPLSWAWRRYERTVG